MHSLGIALPARQVSDCRVSRACSLDKEELEGFGHCSEEGYTSHSCLPGMSWICEAHNTKVSGEYGPMLHKPQAAHLPSQSMYMTQASNPGCCTVVASSLGWLDCYLGKPRGREERADEDGIKVGHVIEHKQGPYPLSLDQMLPPCHTRDHEEAKPQQHLPPEAHYGQEELCSPPTVEWQLMISVLSSFVYSCIKLNKALVEGSLQLSLNKSPHIWL